METDRQTPKTEHKADAIVGSRIWTCQWRIAGYLIVLEGNSCLVLATVAQGEIPGFEASRDGGVVLQSREGFSWLWNKCKVARARGDLFIFFPDKKEKGGRGSFSSLFYLFFLCRPFILFLSSSHLFTSTLIVPCIYPPIKKICRQGSNLRISTQKRKKMDRT